jgi:hypothetical protein
MKKRIITVWIVGVLMSIRLLQGGEGHSLESESSLTKESNGATVQSVVKPTGNVPFANRLRAIHALGRRLTASDLDSAYEYLLTPNPSITTDRRSEQWLRNELMNKLVAGQESLPAGLTDMLVNIYQDTRQGVVMRDYAIQQLPLVHAQVSEGERKSIADTLWRATGETDSSIAGTALLGLTKLYNESSLSMGALSPSVSRARLSQSALAIAENPRCGELARLTAVSICGRMHSMDALPVITQLAQTTDSVPLRIAAIAALGDIGTSDARAVLEQVAHESNTRLQPAVESALARFQRKQ